MSDSQEKETWIEIAFIACLTAIRFSTVSICVCAPFGSLNGTVIDTMREREDKEENGTEKNDEQMKKNTHTYFVCAYVLFKYKVV